MAFGAPFLVQTGLVTTQVFLGCGDVDKLWARGGPLLYLAQTAGRAERHAIRERLDAFPGHQCFVTDLLALAQEGER
eukprot:3876720-Pyramimonas_sp.AAC.1